MSNNRTMNLVGYVRVSSEEQIQNFSLETQEDYIRQETLKRGYTLDRIFREEGKSAKTLQRQELIKCLDYCQKQKKNITGLMVYRLDRLSRETSDYLAVRKQLAKYGIELLSATEPIGGTSPTDKFLETILASVATLDNEIRASRARDGLKKRFMSGLPHNVPVGYKVVNKKLIPDDDLFLKVKRSWEMMATGKYSLSQVAEYMNKMGIKTKYNKRHYKITKKSATRIFRYKIYHGVLESNKHGELRGGHEKMISEYLYCKVRTVIGGKAQNNNPRRLRLNPKFPLRRIIKCSVCDTGYTGSYVRGRGKKYAYYYCPHYCEPSGPQAEVNDKLIEFLRKITPTINTINNFNKLIKAEYQKRHTKLKEQRSINEKKANEARMMLKMLIKGHASGKYPDNVFEEMKKDFEHDVIVKHVISNEALIDKYNLESVLEFNKVFLKDLAKPYILGDIQQKIVYLGSIFPEGVYWKNNLIEPLKLGTMYAYLNPLGYVGRGVGDSNP